MRRTLNMKKSKINSTILIKNTSENNSAVTTTESEPQPVVVF
jgi:hypothetical protein